ncbi:MAG: VOC family protein [Pseudomonadota bacterium]
MQVTGLDHLVLTVADLDRTIRFYEQALGMRVVEFGEGRLALSFGNQKINLHQARREFEPKAARPTPGSADLCFLTDTPMDDVIAHLGQLRIDILDGPVSRTGATGALQSIYVRDPDANLVEIANLLP